MLIPFKKEFDTDQDLILIATFRGTPKNKNSLAPYYETKIGYNALEKVFIDKKCFCQCVSFQMGRLKEENFCCKHIKELKEESLKFPEELA